MFSGHFALGFAAKGVAPSVSLGTTFLAAQLADLLWPTLVLLGVERVRIEPGATAVTPLAFDSYPWSHSLLALVAWAALFAATYRLVRRGPAVAALTLAALVVSHWVLVANVASPPPPSVTAVAWVGHATWLLVAWGYWIDRHRVATPAG